MSLPRGGGILAVVPFQYLEQIKMFDTKNFLQTGQSSNQKSENKDNDMDV